ncbi:MAG: hypothetical protein ABS92_12580 [Thiobacillus sp. SCN 63-374]|nr:MAG: hypothetical protein ABS92_12580 [Thiobacillus sp. SCN 63-374]HRK76958.1 IS3 family transposase [Thiobacillus sp.]
MKHAFMREPLRQFSAAAMKRVLKVSRSGFYDGCNRLPSGRHQANARLLSHIHQIHLAHRQAYGAVKTWRGLNEAGIARGKHRVARLRREAVVSTDGLERRGLAKPHARDPGYCIKSKGRLRK